MRRSILWTAVVALVLLAALPLSAQTLPVNQQPQPLAAMARMPVKEVTVFKDGHALVVHSGKMPTDAAGNVVMDYLPSPVLGTFWPYSSEKDAKLQAVVAGQRKVSIERTAMTLNELIEANIGSEVMITEVGESKDVPPRTYAATIAGIPTRSSAELEAAAPPNSPPMLPQKSSMVLLKTGEGVKALRIDLIRDITLKGQPKDKTSQEEFRNLLTLKLGWKDNKPAKQADMGLMYLQKGIRWIPSYKVTIDGKGKANVELQATLINELTDLDDVSMHLVVGVPTFMFQNERDPMALQQQMAQLSQYFQRDSQTAYAMSNSIMSQQAHYERAPEAAAPAPADLGPEAGQTGRKEDLFIYDISHVTLRKGQRMVLPIGQFTLSYKDVYTLAVPVAPPPEVWGNVMEYIRGQYRSSGSAEVARLFNAPKVMHKIRLTNDSKSPLTTAPALIMQDGRVLAQNLMQYTSAGGEVDLAITTAVDISVVKKEKETARTPNALTINSTHYTRNDMEGTLTLTNRKDKAVDIEVSRFVLGKVGAEISEGGTAQMINALEDPSFVPDAAGAEPSWYWWRGYNWPSWWERVNGVGKVSWKLKLDPGKSVELKYTWSYYWD